MGTASCLGREGRLSANSIQVILGGQVGENVHPAGMEPAVLSWAGSGRCVPSLELGKRWCLPSDNLRGRPLQTCGSQSQPMTYRWSRGCPGVTCRQVPEWARAPWRLHRFRGRPRPPVPLVVRPLLPPCSSQGTPSPGSPRNIFPRGCRHSCPASALGAVKPGSLRDRDSVPFESGCGQP